MQLSIGAVRTKLLVCVTVAIPSIVTQTTTYAAPARGPAHEEPTPRARRQKVRPATLQATPAQAKTQRIHRRDGEALRRKRQAVEVYLSAVEVYLRPITSKPLAVGKLITSDWRASIAAQVERKPFSAGFMDPHYQLSMWKPAKRTKGWPLGVSVVVHLQSQFPKSLRAIGPRLICIDPKQGLRYAWYLRTGDVALDNQIIDRIKAMNANVKFVSGPALSKYH